MDPDDDVDEDDEWDDADDDDIGVIDCGGGVGEEAIEAESSLFKHNLIITFLKNSQRR